MAFDLKQMLSGIFGNMANQMSGSQQQQVIFPRPQVQLLPSQQAMTDIHLGSAAAADAMERGKAKARGMYRYGGLIRPDEEGIVGDGTGDPRAMEVVKVRPDGKGAQVTPLMNPAEAMAAQQVVQPRKPLITDTVSVKSDGPDESTVDWSSVQQNEAAKPSMVDEQTREGELQDQIRAAMQIKSSPWKDFGAALIQAGDNYFNKKDEPLKTFGEIKRDKKLATLLPQLQMEQSIRQTREQSEARAAEATYKGAQAVKNVAEAQKMYADIESQRKKDALAGKDWDKYIVGNKVFMKFKDGHTEPWIDPTTKQQGVDKTKITAKSPITGTDVDIDPEELYRGESNIVVGNAQRQQAVDIHNSDKELEVQKTNVSNLMKYADDVRGVLKSIADVSSSVLSASPEAQRIANDIQAKADEISALRDVADDPDADLDTKNKALAQMHSIQKQIESSQKDFYGNLSKVQGGQAIIDQLKKAMPSRPKMVKYNPVKASQVKGPKISKTDDPLGLFR